MQPGDLIVLNMGFLGLNMSLVSLRRDTSYSHMLHEGDILIMLESRFINERFEGERNICNVLTKLGKMWCYGDELAAHSF